MNHARTAWHWLLRQWWRIEAFELERWLRDISHCYALNGMPADSGHARACRARLAELEVRIALLQPPIGRARAFNP